MAVVSKIAREDGDMLITNAEQSASPEESYDSSSSGSSTGEMVRKVTERKRLRSDAGAEAMVQKALSTLIFDPSGGRAIAQLEPVRPYSPPLYLNTASAETHEERRSGADTKEEEKNNPEKGGKGLKAKAKAKLKKAKLRAKEAARAGGKGKGKGKGIEKAQGWKGKGREIIDKLLGREDINEFTNFKVSEFLNTISKHRIALPEEARPNKPSSSSTPFPHPQNYIHDFVHAFERNTPGGTKNIPNITDHIWNRDGEFGRIIDLLDLDFSHRQTSKFNLFAQDGIVVRPRFRIHSLPAPVIRQIFSHVLTQEVIVPYRYHSDPFLRTLLHQTGHLSPPTTNLLVALCSQRLLLDEARNVLYNSNKFLFRAPQDFIHFVSAIGPDNLARLHPHKNLLFTPTFFPSATPAETHWLATTGPRAIRLMDGLRAFKEGWEDPDVADRPARLRNPPPQGKIPRHLVWDESKPMVYEPDRRDDLTYAPVPKVTKATRTPYGHVAEGAQFSDWGGLFHVQREDVRRAAGVYDDWDGMGVYHLGFWHARGHWCRWYERELWGEKAEGKEASEEEKWFRRFWARESEEEKEEGGEDDEKTMKGEGEDEEGTEKGEGEKEDGDGEGGSDGEVLEGWSEELEEQIHRLMQGANSGEDVDQ